MNTDHPRHAPAPAPFEGIGIPARQRRTMEAVIADDGCACTDDDTCVTHTVFEALSDGATGPDLDLLVVDLAPTAWGAPRRDRKTLPAPPRALDHPAPVAAAEKLEDALQVIAADGCERLTSGHCYDDANDWSREGADGATSWCDPCVAIDALLSVHGECPGTGMLPGAAITVADTDRVHGRRAVELVCPACNQTARQIGMRHLPTATDVDRVPRHPGVQLP